MIETLKDLEKFFKLCRKQGVTEANLVSHTYKFGDPPEQQTTVIETEQTDDSEIDQLVGMPGLSYEELINYSVKNPETEQ